MLTYLPSELEDGSPLVVLLHGCRQTAESLAAGAGWLELAERRRFALLLPEQRTSNNRNGCFNWFLPQHTRRGRGEAGSIRAMIEHIVVQNSLDRGRIFVAGLSAGGAMTSVMLATYPDVFAAGAIMAGLPYGGALNIQQAFESMSRGRSRPSREWAYLVRRASSHKGPWPKISVWHGSADGVVQPMNAGEIIKQWTELHGLPLYPSEAEASDGHQHRVWRGAGGEAMLESHQIAGMAHGIPVAARHPSEARESRPFMIEVGIPSSHRIAQFWGIAESPQGIAASG